MIENKESLEGYLVGIGIHHVDGTEDFKWLDKPVHNTIVSTGIDHLMRYNNSDVLYYNTSGSIMLGMFTSTSYATSTTYHKGVMYDMAIGTGTSATTYSMTGLESPCQDSSGNIFSHNLKTGIPYCGSQNLTKVFGNVSMRITQRSIAVTSETTVTEFGMFGEYVDSGTTYHPMFARIVLPSEIRPTLQAGESVLLTYQLNFKSAFANIDATDLGNIGILDQFGADTEICAEARSNRYVSNSSSWGNYNYAGRNDCIETTGYDKIYGPYSGMFYFLTCCDRQTGSTGTWLHEDAGAYITSNTEWHTSVTSSGPSNTYFHYKDSSSETWDNYVNSYKYIDSYTPGNGYVTYKIKIDNRTSNTVNMYWLRHGGVDYRFYKMVDGTKTYTPIALTAGAELVLNFKYTLGVETPST